MTKEELEARIEKKAIQIQKIERRIQKWSKNLSQEEIEVAKKAGLSPYTAPDHAELMNQYREYCRLHDYDFLSDIDELRRAYGDLVEAQATLDKYKEQIVKIDSFEKEEKVEVIWQFLLNWKESARNYYHREVEKLNELMKWYREQFDLYANKLEYKDEWDEAYHEYVARLGTFDGVTKRIREHGGLVNEEELEKILSKEIEYKYKHLMAQIKDITGEITDASNLHIGGKGEINGFIVGEKGKAKIETFGAGGWNIQIAHWRTKVTPMK